MKFLELGSLSFAFCLSFCLCFFFFFFFFFWCYSDQTSLKYFSFE